MKRAVCVECLGRHFTVGHLALAALVNRRAALAAKLAAVVIEPNRLSASNTTHGHGVDAPQCIL